MTLKRAERFRADIRRRKAKLPQRINSTNLGLPAFVGASPNLEPPDHLKPLTDLFERIANGETVRALVSTPPQHGKSVSVLHALVWLLRRNPKQRHAYVTFAQQFSRDQSLVAQRIADHHGLALERDTQDRWTTSAGGGVVWTSRGGPLTGHAVDGVLIVDDLIKDREEANSQLIRDKAWSWLSSVAMTRMHPGSSIIMIGTRWHLDDPHGRALEQGGWEYIRLPAITDGKALWHMRPLGWLEQQKANLIQSDWSAMYMCEPIAEGSHVFGPTTYYDELPEGGYREAHGFDAAYTAKTSSDYTVTLTGRLINGKVYLTNMLRAQQEPMHYIPMMKAHGVNKVTWFRSGTERGLEELLKREGIQVNAITAHGDKLARAIPAATAWNRGDILTPRANWTPALESELSQFTGHGDAHDDIVDALAGLHAALFGTAITSAKTARSLYR